MAERPKGDAEDGEGDDDRPVPDDGPADDESNVIAGVRRVDGLQGGGSGVSLTRDPRACRIVSQTGDWERTGPSCWLLSALLFKGAGPSGPSPPPCAATLVVFPATLCVGWVAFAPPSIAALSEP